MGQTLEMLLGADPAKLKNVPTGKMEIKRLSRQFGKPFFISYRAATIDEMNEIGDKASGGQAEEMVWTIYELATDPNFKDAALREKFGVARPVDIVRKLFLGGEILSIYKAIMTLSGFDKDQQVDVDAVKN
ncbi:hypothetical protein GTO89_06360 [Heliobacterium gestii]|uniref:Phage XkdN-like protein n=1 Tax=Heliomicrobium gestii TaxID=2699 RepID=A0A845LCK7_HELGE|nr:hypothetical protein [Heliomicrobium gestii]MBM7866007.1 hypothetical protein [Heliomicrobium gestii]MZP42660.1 hypothetical protein [Heliomicrobium gestii]